MDKQIIGNKDGHVSLLDSNQNDGYWALKEEDTFEVAPGLIHSHQLFRGKLLQSIHILEVDLKSPYIQPIVFSSHGKVDRLETVGKMQDQLLKVGKRIVAGVNGDFFNWLGVPSGLQIQNGEIVTSPSYIKVLLAIMPDGTVELKDQVTMSAFILDECGCNLKVDNINRTRYLTQQDHAVIYSWRFGSTTRTPEGGVEVVLTVSDDRLLLGKRINGVVDSIKETDNTSIEHGKLVLSLTGLKADWARENLKVGEKVSIDISCDRGVDEAKHVISGNSTLGYMLLKDGEISKAILDPDNPHNHDRHPRTMVATQKGKMFIVVVDGRQPEHSDGITLAEGACYLKSKGMENAINIDGGGSTACYIRHAGDEYPSLINLPSDGYERTVGNALFFESVAPISELNKLVLTPKSTIRVLASSKITFKVKGQDQFFNAVPVKQSELEWLVNEELGSIQTNGEFTASKKAASGHVIVRRGKIVQDCHVKVVERIAGLKAKQSGIVVEPGGEWRIDLQAFDEQGNVVWVSPELLEWSVEGLIGEITPSGILKASRETTKGAIIVRYSSVDAKINISVGKPPYVITNFESLEGMSVYSDRAVPGSVTLTRAPRPQPVRFGTFSGKLTYDFTNISGSSKAVIQFSNQSGEKGLQIEGRPYRFGVWVYGDANGHWLRLGITDANGEHRPLNFTEHGGLDWHGWKYVHAKVAEGTAFPITLHYLFIVETNDANKNAGTLYFNRLRAEYFYSFEELE
ncbi:phosphodiester glycosidase family protein [Bacillus niameyensis]|uniref:phosphodiester glycosidase family protein n=1 Tax=Bacillus niameyensis TaxID=1522308 RepID=UPI000784E0F2|nr:phosphodiester glycosidase family protein [Bacillus niameyensis]